MAWKSCSQRSVTEIVLIVGKKRHPVEAAQEGAKLLELESRSERDPPNPVSVEEESEAVVSVRGFIDDFVVRKQLRLLNDEMDVAIFGDESAQTLEQLGLEPLGDTVSRIIEALGFLGLDHEPNQLADARGPRRLRRVLGGQCLRGQFRGTPIHPDRKQVSDHTSSEPKVPSLRGLVAKFALEMRDEI